MKKVIAIVAVCGMASQVWADYVWTSETDGTYNSSMAWNHDGKTEFPGTSPSENVMIDKAVTVTYTDGSDFQPQAGTVFTVANGATFRQTVVNWPLLGGRFVVDGATAEFSEPDRVRVGATGSVEIKNDGAFVCKSLNFIGAAGKLVLTQGTLTVDSVVECTEASLEVGGGEWSFSSLPAFKNFKISGGMMTLGGNFTPKTDHAYTGGAVVVSGELQPQDGVLFDGVDWTCNIFSPQGQNSVITFKSGSVTCLTTGFAGGFWQSPGTYINVPEDSNIAWSFKGTKANAYSATFGTSMFRYKGESLDAATFATLFDVSENAGLVTIRTHVDSETNPELGSYEIKLAAGSDTAVVVRANITKLGGENTTAHFVYDVADRGEVLESWSHAHVLTVAETGSVAETVTLDLPPRSKAICRILVVNNDTNQCVMSDAVPLYLRDYGVAGTVNEWVATEGNWADGVNWSLGHAPAAGEIVWVENPNAVISAGGTTINPSDRYVSGTLNVGGELKIGFDYTLKGFMFSCTTLLLDDTTRPTLTVVSGGIRALRISSPGDARGGVYYNGTINFVEGSNPSWTCYTKEGIYTDTFGGTKFKFNGQTLSSEEFAEKFVVTEGDAHPVAEGYKTVTMTLVPVVGKPQFDSVETVYDHGAVTFEVTLTETSPADTEIWAFYDSTDHERNTDFGWPDRVKLVKGENGVFVASVPVTPDTDRYYYNLRAASASTEQSVWTTGSFVAFDLPADENTWLGKVSSEITNPQNWSLKRVPGETDIVNLDRHFATGTTLNWNAADVPVVAGWKQNMDITVIFNTTKDRAFSVTGDVELSNGAGWTHVGPCEDGVFMRMLNVIVGGDMTIGAGSLVHAGHWEGERNRARGYFRSGPGWEDIPTVDLHDNVRGYSYYYGASHGGDGGYSKTLEPTGRQFVTYGSILNPLDYGAAGHGDNGMYAGGGVVKLVVAGTLTVDGAIESTGFGYPAETTGGASAGGSVNVRAAMLAGSGLISAEGGFDRIHGNGSGGRVLVEVTGTGAAIPGTIGIHAFGGTMLNGAVQEKNADIKDAAAGTVVLRTVSDHADICRLLIKNAREGAGYTHLPSAQNLTEDLSEVDVEILDHGCVRLTGPSTHLTKIKSLTINGQLVKSGIYTAERLNALLGGDATVFTGDASLKVGSIGFLLVVR